MEIRGGVALALFGVLAMSYASDEIAPAAQPERIHGFWRSSPAIADLDPSRPGLDVAIMDARRPRPWGGPGGGRLYVLHGDDGTLHWCVDIPGSCADYPNYSPAIADVRSDMSGLEIVATMLDNYLYVFNVPGTEVGPAPWPMFQHDRHHTGLYGYVPQDHEGP